MPSKYPVCKSSEVCKALERLGFRFVSQKGSHMKYANGSHIAIIPKHDEIAKGTLKGILEKANIRLESFLNALQ